MMICKGWQECFYIIFFYMLLYAFGQLRFDFSGVNSFVCRAFRQWLLPMVVGRAMSSMRCYSCLESEPNRYCSYYLTRVVINSSHSLVNERNDASIGFVRHIQFEEMNQMRSPSETCFQVNWVVHFQQGFCFHILESRVQDHNVKRIAFTFFPKVLLLLSFVFQLGNGHSSH